MVHWYDKFWDNLFTIMKKFERRTMEKTFKISFYLFNMIQFTYWKQEHRDKSLIFHFPACKDEFVEQIINWPFSRRIFCNTSKIKTFSQDEFEPFYPKYFFTSFLYSNKVGILTLRVVREIFVGNQRSNSLKIMKKPLCVRQAESYISKKKLSMSLSQF